MNEILKGRLDPTRQTDSFGYRWLTQAHRPALENPTSVELIAHRGARVVLLDVVDDTAYALVAAFAASMAFDYGDPLVRQRDDAPSDASIVVRLPVSLLSKTELTLVAPKLRPDARDQARYLYGAPDATDAGVALTCGEVEILADLPGRVQHLRQLHEGIELRGFTRIPLEWTWASNSCRPRLVELASDGPRPPRIPADHVRLSAAAADDAVGYLKSGKPLYSVELSDTGTECIERKLVDGQLTVIQRTGPGAARRELTYGASFPGGSLVELTGPSIEERDARGKTLENGALGCLSFFHFVQSTPDALLLFHAWSNPIVAYHPDDATPWFKTKAACERAVEAHPRLRLTPGQHSQVASVPLRLTGGC